MCIWNFSKNYFTYIIQRFTPDTIKNSFTFYFFFLWWKLFHFVNNNMLRNPVFQSKWQKIKNQINLQKKQKNKDNQKFFFSTNSTETRAQIGAWSWQAAYTICCGEWFCIHASCFCWLWWRLWCDLPPRWRHRRHTLWCPSAKSFL